MPRLPPLHRPLRWKVCASCLRLYAPEVSLLIRVFATGTLLISEREFQRSDASADFVLHIPSVAPADPGRLIVLDGVPVESLKRVPSGTRVRLNLSPKFLQKQDHKQRRSGRALRSNASSISELSWADVDGMAMLPFDGSSIAYIPSVAAAAAVAALTLPSQSDSSGLQADVVVSLPLTAAAALQGGTTSASASSSTRPVASTISMVVYIVDMCGKGGGPAATARQVEDLLFHNDGNLASYFGTCSYGRAKLSPSTTRIISNVTMPCSGTTSGVSWSVNSCTPLDYYGWQLWLQAWSAEQGIDVSPYVHRIIVLPKNLTSFMLPASDCGFTGIGVVGPVVSAATYAPGVFSFAWISGDYWNQPQSWMHEIGHNYFLRHSDLPPTPSNPVRGGRRGSNLLSGGGTQKHAPWSVLRLNPALLDPALIDPTIVCTRSSLWTSPVTWCRSDGL